eukprot:3411346-Ditylum_brightwellii.AAC.1
MLQSNEGNGGGIEGYPSDGENIEEEDENYLIGTNIESVGNYNDNEGNRMVRRRRRMNDSKNNSNKKGSGATKPTGGSGKKSGG